jgi:NAD+ synthetase
MEIKLIQQDYTVGDLKGNSELIMSIIKKEAQEKVSNILVFSELAVSGYPPLDLLDSTPFINSQLGYVSDIVLCTKDNPALVIFGYVERNPGIGRNLFNSVLVCKNGEIIYNYRKRLLPTYDIFDEARYFEPGNTMGLFCFKEKRIGLVICEDLWYKNKFYTLNPAQELFNAKADMIISINASPSVAGKYRQKLDMITGISKTYGLPILYTNQTGGNDDIVFDGNSFVVNERGVLVAHAERFKDDVLSVPLEALQPHAPGYAQGIAPRYYGSDAQFFYEQAVCGIRSYIKKCGFRGVVIGESGGIDSAVVTALAADALGGSNVVGITMPSQYSSEGSYVDSETLCKNFGVTFYTYPIKDAFDTILTQFCNIFPEDKPGLMEENLQARIRGQLLMSFSNRYGYLVLSTGNKSEMSVGYTTVGGDLMGGLSPISDQYKMEVYAVAKYINELHKKEMIPYAIIDKEPSAELAPNQRDVDSLPPYPILDAILKYIIEGETLAPNEYAYCYGIVRDNEESTTRVLKLVNKAEFKRRLAPITIKMHDKAFGYGRRIPVAQKWERTQ